MRWTSLPLFSSCWIILCFLSLTSALTLQLPKDPIHIAEPFQISWTLAAEDPSNFVLLLFRADGSGPVGIDQIVDDAAGTGSRIFAISRLVASDKLPGMYRYEAVYRYPSGNGNTTLGTSPDFQVLAEDPTLDTQTIGVTTTSSSTTTQTTSPSPTSITTGFSTSTSSTSSLPSQTAGSSNIPVGAIAGGTVAAAMLILAIIVVGICLRRSKKHDTEHRRSEITPNPYLLPLQDQSLLSRLTRALSSRPNRSDTVAVSPNSPPQRRAMSIAPSTVSREPTERQFLMNSRADELINEINASTLALSQTSHPSERYSLLERQGSLIDELERLTEHYGSDLADAALEVPPPYPGSLSGSERGSVQPTLPRYTLGSRMGDTRGTMRSVSSLRSASSLQSSLAQIRRERLTLSDFGSQSSSDRQ